MTTPGQNQKGKNGLPGYGKPTAPCSLIFFPWIWEPYEVSKRASIYIRFQARSFMRPARKLILKGADGVIFVADSQEERLDANFETMEKPSGAPEGAQS